MPPSASKKMLTGHKLECFREAVDTLMKSKLLSLKDHQILSQHHSKIPEKKYFSKKFGLTVLLACIGFIAGFVSENNWITVLFLLPLILYTGFILRRKKILYKQQWQLDRMILMMHDYIIVNEELSHYFRDRHEKIKDIKTMVKSDWVNDKGTLVERTVALKSMENLQNVVICMKNLTDGLKTDHGISNVLSKISSCNFDRTITGNASIHKLSEIILETHHSYKFGISNFLTNIGFKLLESPSKKEFDEIISHRIPQTLKVIKKMVDSTKVQYRTLCKNIDLVPPPIKQQLHNKLLLSPLQDLMFCTKSAFWTTRKTIKDLDMDSTKKLAIETKIRLLVNVQGTLDNMVQKVIIMHDMRILLEKEALKGVDAVSALTDFQFPMSDTSSAESSSILSEFANLSETSLSTSSQRLTVEDVRIALAEIQKSAEEAELKQRSTPITSATRQLIKTEVKKFIHMLAAGKTDFEDSITSVSPSVSSNTASSIPKQVLGQESPAMSGTSVTPDVSFSTSRTSYIPRAKLPKELQLKANLVKKIGDESPALISSASPSVISGSTSIGSSVLDSKISKLTAKAALIEHLGDESAALMSSSVAPSLASASTLEISSEATRPGSQDKSPEEILREKLDKLTLNTFESSDTSESESGFSIKHATPSDDKVIIDDSIKKRVTFQPDESTSDSSVKTIVEQSEKKRLKKPRRKQLKAVESLTSLSPVSDTASFITGATEFSIDTNSTTNTYDVTHKHQPITNLESVSNISIPSNALTYKTGFTSFTDESVAGTYATALTKSPVPPRRFESVTHLTFSTDTVSSQISDVTRHSIDSTSVGSSGYSKSANKISKTKPPPLESFCEAESFTRSSGHSPHSTSLASTATSKYLMPIERWTLDSLTNLSFADTHSSVTEITVCETESITTPSTTYATTRTQKSIPEHEQLETFESGSSLSASTETPSFKTGFTGHTGHSVDLTSRATSFATAKSKHYQPIRFRDLESVSTLSFSDTQSSMSGMTGVSGDSTCPTTGTYATARTEPLQTFDSYEGQSVASDKPSHTTESSSVAGSTTSYGTAITSKGAIPKIQYKKTSRRRKK